MRTAEERFIFYWDRRKEMNQFQKNILSVFEGQKWFRFGNSWRRKADGWKLILDDHSENFIIIDPQGIEKEI
uniref:Uncharacterized protein n=1 Tax=viral metagenome TaxID=1070528 RepID=A0A6M3KW07_9ZZZZ